MNKRIRIGEIGVDAGLCWIGDPCYILHKNTGELNDLKRVIGKDWGEFCDLIGDMKHGKQLNYPLGHPGLGVVVQTGYGDGTYPVYATISDEYVGGERVTSVTVEFISEEE